MIKLFIRRPVFTTMLVMLLVVFGVTSYPSLGIDLYPDIDFPIVTVRITYTGASPEEMEGLITKPVEDAVSSVSGIKTLSSTSREGISETIIEFELGTNAKMAANDVREKVAGVRRRLPDEIDEPVVQRYDITAQSIMTYSLASETRERGEIRKIAENGKHAYYEGEIAESIAQVIQQSGGCPHGVAPLLHGGCTRVVCCTAYHNAVPRYSDYAGRNAYADPVVP